MKVNMNKIKDVGRKFGSFVKNNKLSCAMWFGSGMMIGAKVYSLATVLTIIGVANYAMDRVVDSGIREAMIHTWNAMTPDQRRELIKIANTDSDE